MDRPRHPGVQGVEIVQLEGPGQGLPGQEQGGHHQQVEGGQPAQQGERAEG